MKLTNCCALMFFYACAAVADPSPETLQKAKSVGMRPEVRKGITVYCWEDADLGTRFKTKKCVNEDGLEDTIRQREAQLQQLQSHVGQH
jgi:hypothetical protein